MNYQKHYDTLIQKAENRNPPNDIEHHHVVPICMGGTDDPHNIAKLTPKEHYTAHLLLAKLYDTYVLWQAAELMTHCNPFQNRSNRLYSWVKRNRVRTQHGTKRSEETKEKMRQAQLGTKKSEETKQKLRKPKPDGFGKKVSKWRKDVPVGESKMLTCPKCGKQGQARGLKVWHFDRCRKP